MPTDEILVKKALAGNKEDFGKLVEKYASAVYGLAYHLVGNFTDAQDLAQQTFISAYTKLYQLQEHSKFASWLRTITTNICRTWLRKQREEKTALESITERKMSGNQLTPEESVLAKEERDLVMKAVASLPEKSRLAVTLYYLDGMSYQQIADFLSVSRSAIDSRLTRARQKLKQEMIAMMERTFTEHKLPKDFRGCVMENLSNRWIDLYGGLMKRLDMMLKMLR